MEHKAAVSKTEIDFLQEAWSKKIAADSKYWLENDAKIRAISSAQSYEEFSDIVKAAHLKPLTKKELMELQNRKSSNWDCKKVDSTIINVLPKENKEIEHSKTHFETSAQFESMWERMANSERLCFLETVPLKKLDEILRQEVPPGLIGDLARILKYEPDKEEWLIDLLKILTKSNRFKLNLLFLRTDEAEFYKELVKQLKRQNEEVEVLKKEFGLCK